MEELETRIQLFFSFIGSQIAFSPSLFSGPSVLFSLAKSSPGHQRQTRKVDFKTEGKNH